MSDVVIAGAGPVGLALAVELSTRGIACTVVDPGVDRRGAPRAKLTNVRSMEHMRRWGLASRIREVAPLPVGYSNEIVFVTKLTGHELTRFTDVFATTPIRREEFPEPAQQIPQYLVEDVLREAVIASPLVTFIADRVTGFEEQPDGVRVELENSTVETSYLVGCDGGRSTVRKAMGTQMVGQHAMTKNLGIVFRAPGLESLHPHGPALHYWLVNEDAPGFMGPLDGRDTWWLIRTGVPEGQELSELDPAQLVIDAVGRPVSAEVLGVDPWQAHRLTAASVATARVFLAGDSAHLHPPFGAHGMNMGIGDAVDLGWKLAATREGFGGRSLLSSYVSERAPLHQRVVDEASLNNARLANEFVSNGLEVDAGARRRAAQAIQSLKFREFSSLGLVLGHSFDYSPLVISDGTDLPESSVTEYTPTARPGSLLPHRWLGDGSSLYDRLGPWFTLLVSPGTSALADAFRQASARLAVPLEILEDDRPDAVLVRPDRIIAWRKSTDDIDPGQVLATAVGRQTTSDNEDLLRRPRPTTRA